ncbi:hypothetical protein GOODEAATRI_023053, partial [Goodea atripinnis]
QGKTMENLSDIIPFAKEMLRQRPTRSMLKIYMLGSTLARGTKAASSPAENYHLARRRTLQVVVSALLTESGFESAEKAAVETLTEMMQSCTYESKK